MYRSVFLSLVLCTATFAVAQNTPSSPANQQQPQGQPPGPAQTVQQQQEEQNAVAPAPPAFSPSTGASSGPSPAMRMIRVSGGVMAGQNVSKAAPVYPPDAKAAGMEGVVVLAAMIDKDGTVKTVQPISGPPSLCDAAVAAVRQWTYRPYILNGHPVAVNTTVTVNFALASASSMR